jgi:hypothetical protein
MAKAKDEEAKAEEALAEAEQEEVVADEEFEEELAVEAAAQSQEERQVVPERRPQAFLGAMGGDSAAGKRAAARAAKAMGPEEYAAAEPKEGESEGRARRLYPGQRVVIIAPNEEAGRMAFVQTINYTDALQELLASSGTPEASFAEVESYIVQTRDGRSDLLDVLPSEVEPLETIGGWGRGQI